MIRLLRGREKSFRVWITEALPPAKVEFVAVAFSPSLPHVLNVATGADGTIWVVTGEDTYFSQDEGMSWHSTGVRGSSRQRSAVDSNGTLYTGSRANKYYAWGDEDAYVIVITESCQTGAVVSSYSPSQERWNKFFPQKDGCLDVFDIVVTPDGTRWIADSIFITVLEGSSERTRWIVLKGEHAKRLGSARDGGIWGGVNEQITHYRRENEDFLKGRTISGLPVCALINTIVDAPNGTLWVGTDAGLYKTPRPFAISH